MRSIRRHPYCDLLHKNSFKILSIKLLQMTTAKFAKKKNYVNDKESCDAAASAAKGLGIS